MARASIETEEDFKARMESEGWFPKFFIGDSVTVVRKMHRFYKKRESVLELSDEYHPKSRNTFWFRERKTHSTTPVAGGLSAAASVSINNRQAASATPEEEA